MTSDQTHCRPSSPARPNLVPLRMISAQSWFNQSATKRVMLALNAQGGDRARFVGGCVRNALLGRDVADIDIATQHRPDEVMRIAGEHAITAIPTGLAHGTVSLIVEHVPFEVTTLRRDVATDGRHAQVAFTDDWALDAARRDFYLNALYADASGAIYDPTGQGLADMQAGRVRFIGDPAQRLAEDRLRALRFFRFHAHYGRSSLDEAGLCACRASAKALGMLSVERVWKELKGIFAAPDARLCVEAMHEIGIFRELTPELSNLKRYGRLTQVDLDHFFEPDPLLRIAACLTDAQSAAIFADRLKLAARERERLIHALQLAESSNQIHSFMSVKALRRAGYYLGQPRFLDQIRLHWAEQGDARTELQWRTLFSMAQSWQPPAMPLGGAQIIAAGVSPGPRIGEILRHVEEWWVDMDFPDDDWALAERLKAVIAGIADDHSQ